MATNKTTTLAATTSKRTQTGPFALPLTGTLQIVVASAKLAGSNGAKRYALYRNGQTVAAYIAASVAKGNRPALAKADLMWDFNHGFISCTGHSLKPLGAPTRGKPAVVVATKAKATKPAATVPAIVAAPPPATA